MEFYRRHAATEVPILPWQAADLDALGLTAAECDTAVQWARPGAEPKAGPDAIARLLRASTGHLGAWKLAGLVLSFPPVRWLAWPGYRWVARNRHRMPGGTAACSLPRG
nr:DCC1-like thiol-disulfide oxidoreductase family protein [Stackebrandtia nassauensis]